MHIDCLDELHRVFQFLHILRCTLDHTLAGRASTFLLNLFVVKLLVSESKLLFGALDFIHQLTFVECLLGHNLTPQVLNLRRQPLLYGIIFLTHDFAPDGVQVVQDLANAGLSHFAMELLFDLQDGADSLRRDPVVVFRLFFLFWTPLH